LVLNQRQQQLQQQMQQQHQHVLKAVVRLLVFKVKLLVLSRNVLNVLRQQTHQLLNQQQIKLK
jgi:hypothetical protein